MTTPAGIAAIGAAHRRFGTTGFMVTLISDTRAKTAEAVAAGSAGLAAAVPGLLGIHIEGPFLNVERRGVHAAAMIRPLEPKDLAILISLGAGRTLVTLAPEKVAPEDIRRLVAAGVIVAAGHTASDYETVRQALALGLTGFTHLYNAMPPLMAREPGPVGAALEDRASWCGLIVDLHHVSAASLKIAIAAKGPEHMMLVTDAMATVGSDLDGIHFPGPAHHARRRAADDRGGKGGRHARRLRSRHGDRGAQHRGASGSAAGAGARHGQPRPRRLPAASTASSAASPRAIAPAWCSSTRRCRCRRPGSTGRRASSSSVIPQKRE